MPVLLLAIGSPAAAQAVHQSFDLVVPRAPVPVTVDGETRLVYELHITNFARVDLRLTRIEVLDYDRPGEPLADLQAEELVQVLGGPGIRSADADRRLIAPGRRGVAYFWLPLDPSSAVPAGLTHRIGFREASADTGEATVVQGGAAVLSEEEPVALGPPLIGGPWVAVYDPAAERGHRRVLLAVDGRVRIPARFAIDWIRVDEEGRLARGDASRVATWHGYGAEVLAVADATVVAMRDSIDESPTLSNVAHGLEKGSGNYVTLDLGDGRYVSYEHLKPRSVRIDVGDRVREGEVIAQVGYTGDSTGPHLHMHVSDGATPLAGEGVPWVIWSFEVLGSYPSLPSLTAFAEGVPWTPPPPGTSGTRSMELPAPFSVVEFGGSPAGSVADQSPSSADRDR
ncbi:MAG: M23 family metallopeptidase [Gemmatimonadota bacterium]